MPTASSAGTPPDPSCSFATGKVAALMALESQEAVALPQAIQFEEAIAVAAIGLLAIVALTASKLLGRIWLDALETDRDTRICDLSVWYSTLSHLAAAIAVVTQERQMPVHSRSLLRGIPSRVHVKVEVNLCPVASCLGVIARPRARATSGTGLA